MILLFPLNTSISHFDWRIKSYKKWVQVIRDRRNIPKQIKYMLDWSMALYHFFSFFSPASRAVLTGANLGVLTMVSQRSWRHSRVGIVLQTVGVVSDEKELCAPLVSYESNISRNSKCKNYSWPAKPHEWALRVSTLLPPNRNLHNVFPWSKKAL